MTERENWTPSIYSTVSVAFGGGMALTGGVIFGGVGGGLLTFGLMLFLFGLADDLRDAILSRDRDA